MAFNRKSYTVVEKLKSIFLHILAIMFAIGLGVLLAFGFCKMFVIQEGSMDTTLSAGETVLINRFAYYMGEPKRGDIIAYKLNNDENASTHVKRIIGLPGETIQIKDGQILIDGETYQEQKNFPSIENPGIAEEGVTLGNDEYFVLGDNRNNSEDSRFVDVGNIKKSNVIGKLWFVVSPLDEFGFLKD